MLRSRPVFGIVVVLAGVVAFFASREIAASLGEGAEDGRPQIEVFAIPSVPPPPAWPQSERTADEEGDPETGEDPSGAGAAREEEPEPAVEEVPVDSGDSPAEPVQPPPPPSPSENQGAGSGEESGGGWVTGGQVGG